MHEFISVDQLGKGFDSSFPVVKTFIIFKILIPGQLREAAERCSEKGSESE